MRLLEVGPADACVVDGDLGREGPAADFPAFAAQQPYLAWLWTLAGFCPQLIEREVTEVEVFGDESAVFT
jgi:hypothetical protein